MLPIAVCDNDGSLVLVLKTTTPVHSMRADSHSRELNDRRKMTTEPSMTGMSLADLRTVWVGMSMY